MGHVQLTLGTVSDIIFQERENPNNGNLPLVVVIDFKHYQRPIWDKQQITSDTCTYRSNKKRCEPNCCTWKQKPSHIIWTKTIRSAQGHNAGPTAVNQTPNAIQRIIVHLGDRTYEALNPGLTYMAISRATTIG
jgi:hypothetical protein